MKSNSNHGAHSKVFAHAPFVVVREDFLVRWSQTQRNSVYHVKNALFQHNFHSCWSSGEFCHVVCWIFHVSKISVEFGRNVFQQSTRVMTTGNIVAAATQAHQHLEAWIRGSNPLEAFLIGRKRCPVHGVEVQGIRQIWRNNCTWRIEEWREKS